MHRRSSSLSYSKLTAGEAVPASVDHRVRAGRSTSEADTGPVSLPTTASITAGEGGEKVYPAIRPSERRLERRRAVPIVVSRATWSIFTEAW